MRVGSSSKHCNSCLAQHQVLTVPMEPVFCVDIVESNIEVTSIPSLCTLVRHEALTSSAIAQRNLHLVCYSGTDCWDTTVPFVEARTERTSPRKKARTLSPLIMLTLPFAASRSVLSSPFPIGQTTQIPLTLPATRCITMSKINQHIIVQAYTGDHAYSRSAQECCSGAKNFS